MATTAAPLATLNVALGGSSSVHPNPGPISPLSGGPSRYRGAVVEDLQLPPAFALSQSERVEKAVQLAYDRDFSHIP
ncbi:hypothetical protein FRC09_019821 [Ceratobasidium sp. 395]|nr:hypothetical protein FRC09_019821 [Ceratobasidium sp. 395]